MNVNQAVMQIDTIWQQVARTEAFRGYRANTVAGTGFLGLATALVQAWRVPDPGRDIDGFLSLWVSVATVSCAIVGVELAVRWWRNPSRLEREKTLAALAQFTPCLVAGAAITWILGEVAVDTLWLLPGVWALLFSLGVFASARQVSPAVNFVAAYYALAGMACLYFARGEYAFSPWAMAGSFGVGQLGMAAVLHFYVERRHDA